MADNVAITPGSGATVAADDVGGVLHQRVKLSLGADGAAVDAVAGAGASGTGVQRIISATDDPAVVALALANTSLDNIEASVAAATPAGTNIIGKVGIDQTTPGTTNLVAAGQNGDWNIANVSGTVSLPTGAATEASVAAIAASVSVLDDWDAADRAKVSPIVGQDGIAAGAGAVGVTVPRTTLASDDPAVVALQIMDDWDESDRAKVNLIVGQAGVAAGAGAVSATVQRTTLASDDPAVATLGATTGSAVVTDANGTIQQYLRGLVKIFAAALGGLGTIASAFRVTQAGYQYETVAASQTAQVLGATGATGDYLSHVVIFPTALTAGTCIILDNATEWGRFTTGTLTSLNPIHIVVSCYSVSGAWKITTGASETATGVGNFTA